MESSIRRCIAGPLEGLTASWSLWIFIFETEKKQERSIFQITNQVFRMLKDPAVISKVNVTMQFQNQGQESFPLIGEMAERIIIYVIECH